MSAAIAAQPTPDTRPEPGARSTAETVAGRTSVAARSLTRVAAALAAAELRVPLRDVRVAVEDARGLLAFTVTAPVSLPTLARVAGDRAAIGRHGGALTERSLEVSRRMRDRVEEVTGHRVARVDLVLTGARFDGSARLGDTGALR